MCCLVGMSLSLARLSATDRVVTSQSALSRHVELLFDAHTRCYKTSLMRYTTCQLLLQLLYI